MDENTKKMQDAIFERVKNIDNSDTIRAMGLIMADYEVEKDDKRAKLIIQTVNRLVCLRPDQLEYICSFIHKYFFEKDKL